MLSPLALVWEPSPRTRLASSALSAVARLARSRRTGAPEKNGGAERAILVVELGNIGDIVLLAPFLLELRESFPGAAVTLLARSYASEVLGDSGLVDDFIAAEPLLASGSPYNPLSYPWPRTSSLVRTLRKRSFDLAFQCRMHLREHVLLWLSGARRTVGYAFGEGPSLLTDAVPRTNLDAHRSQDWLGLLAAERGSAPAGMIRLRVGPSHQQWAEEYLAAAGYHAGDTLVAIHAGASVAAKRWPEERFAAVAAQLVQRPRTRVLAFVDPGGVGSRVAALPGILSVRETLPRVVALLERCSLFVGNDSGPMHLAAGLGVPALAIFGPGNPRWFGPLGEGHRILCAPSGREIGAVELDHVVRAMNEMLLRVG